MRPPAWILAAVLIVLVVAGFLEPARTVVSKAMDENTKERYFALMLAMLLIGAAFLYWIMAAAIRAAS